MERVPSDEARLRRVRAALVLGATLALSARLFRFVDRHAVDVLFWDQWDFWDPLFRGDSAWTVFRWQHGPHRQGVGGLLILLVALLSRWSVRAESFVAAGLAVLSAGAALLLARRARGRLSAWDVVLPLLVLGLTSYELYAVTPNLAHGPVPLLCVLLAALGLQLDGARARLAAVLAAGFAATSAGFGLFFGAVLPPLAVLLLAVAVRRRDAVAWHVAALPLSLLPIALFLHGYTLQPAVDCFRFPDAQPWRYLPFAGALFLRPLGLQRGIPHAWVAGDALALGCAGLAGWGALRTLAAGPRWRVHAAVFALAAFSLLFAANVTAGRVCLGVEAAESSRYVPYLTPLLFAAHLALSCAPAPARWRTAALAAFAALCVVKELRLGPERADAAFYAQGKRRFRDCYLATRDEARCSAVFAVYPVPAATRLDEKLRFLEERRLGLFRSGSAR